MKNELQETPEGYSTVCPYLMVESVEVQINFLRKVFQAEVKEEMKQPDGSIGHGEVRIGNVVIMMGKSNNLYPSRKSMNYVFVKNPDEVYNRALEQGATSVMKPVDQSYGNRSGGFIDTQGNEWWVAKPLSK
jgi:PhnB protein